MERKSKSVYEQWIFRSITTMLNTDEGKKVILPHDSIDVKD